MHLDCTEYDTKRCLSSSIRVIIAEICMQKQHIRPGAVGLFDNASKIGSTG